MGRKLSWQGKGPEDARTRQELEHRLQKLVFRWEQGVWELGCEIMRIMAMSSRDACLVSGANVRMLFLT